MKKCAAAATCFLLMMPVAFHAAISEPLVAAQVELERLASVERKRVDPQKLASHKRTLASGPQAHKYIAYYVDEGTLPWVLREDIMAAEARLDG